MFISECLFFIKLIIMSFCYWQTVIWQTTSTKLEYLPLSYSSSLLLCHPYHFSVNTAECLWPACSQCPCQFAWAWGIQHSCWRGRPTAKWCCMPYSIWLQFVIWVYVPHKVVFLSKILPPSETSGLVNMETNERSIMISSFLIIMLCCLHFIYIHR